MDSKDERHRATVRWTVATASDQAPAGARIESCLGRQENALAFCKCFFAYPAYMDSKDERHKAEWPILADACGDGVVQLRYY